MSETPETPPVPEPAAAPEAGAAPEATPEAAPDAAPAPAAPPAPANDLGPAACAAALAQHFPALFGTEQPPRPLKLRIQQDIQQRAPGVFSRRALGVFFHRHTTSTPYLRALVASDARYDLDGQPAGDMAAEHKAAAQEELARRKALADERRAAIRDAQRQAQRAQRTPAPPAAAPATADGTAPAPLPPRPARHARPPRPAQAQAQAQRPAPAPRAQRAPQTQSEQRAPQTQREQRAAPARPEPTNPALREQTLLVRAWQGSTLTKANFCALKRTTEAELDAAIALVQATPPRRG